MHPLRHVLITIAFVLFLVACMQAQIPNAGFETWTNSTTPASWVPDNTGLWTTVSRTSASHSGSYAAQGQVVSYSVTQVAPTLTSVVFPVSQRYTTLSGFYKFTRLGGDLIGAVVVMLKNSSVIGGGAGEDSTAYSSFTQVSIPIYYYDSTTVPDSAYIEIFIGPNSDSSNVHVGSTFVVDDLSFGGVAAVRELPGVPNTFRLEQNFPNPFNPTTQIAFSLPMESHVSLKVYNAMGQEVATLVDEVRTAGNYMANLNAAHLSSGIYFYKLIAGSFIQTNKMILMK